MGRVRFTGEGFTENPSEFHQSYEGRSPHHPEGGNHNFIEDQWEHFDTSTKSCHFDFGLLQQNHSYLTRILLHGIPVTSLPTLHVVNPYNLHTQPGHIHTQPAPTLAHLPTITTTTTAATSSITHHKYLSLNPGLPLVTTSLQEVEGRGVVLEIAVNTLDAGDFRRKLVLKGESEEKGIEVEIAGRVMPRAKGFPRVKATVSCVATFVDLESETSGD